MGEENEKKWELTTTNSVAVAGSQVFWVEERFLQKIHNFFLLKYFVLNKIVCVQYHILSYWFTFFQVVVEAGLYHGSIALCETRTTQEVSFKDGAAVFDEFLTFNTHVCNIPRNTRLCIAIYEVSQSSKVSKARSSITKQVSICIFIHIIICTLYVCKCPVWMNLLRIFTCSVKYSFYIFCTSVFFIFFFFLSYELLFFKWFFMNQNLMVFMVIITGII